MFFIIILLLLSSLLLLSLFVFITITISITDYCTGNGVEEELSADFIISESEDDGSGKPSSIEQKAPAPASNSSLSARELSLCHRSNFDLEKTVHLPAGFSELLMTERHRDRKPVPTEAGSQTRRKTNSRLSPKASHANANGYVESGAIFLRKSRRGSAQPETLERQVGQEASDREDPAERESEQTEERDSEPQERLALEDLKLSVRERFAVLGGEPSLTAIAERLKNSQFHRIIVFTGSGVSAEAGYPPLRHPVTGDFMSQTVADLLAQISEIHGQKITLAPGYENESSLFSIKGFIENSAHFYKLLRFLFPSGQSQPTAAHKFAKLLQDRGLLLRQYTQNIDGLERLAGVNPDQLVEIHGNFLSCHCINKDSPHSYPVELFRSALFASTTAPDEIRCFVPSCNALVKPDFVFAGEALHKRFYQLARKDFASCDLLVMMGASLHSPPFDLIASWVPLSCPRVLLNSFSVYDQTVPGFARGAAADSPRPEGPDVVISPETVHCKDTRKKDPIESAVDKSKRLGKGRKDTDDKDSIISNKEPIQAKGSKKSSLKRPVGDEKEDRSKRNGSKGKQAEKSNSRPEGPAANREGKEGKKRKNVRNVNNTNISSTLPIPGPTAPMRSLGALPLDVQSSPNSLPEPLMGFYPSRPVTMMNAANLDAVHSSVTMPRGGLKSSSITPTSKAKQGSRSDREKSERNERTVLPPLGLGTSLPPLPPVALPTVNTVIGPSRRSLGVARSLPGKPFPVPIVKDSNKVSLGKKIDQLRPVRTGAVEKKKSPVLSTLKRLPSDVDV